MGQNCESKSRLINPHYRDNNYNSSNDKFTNINHVLNDGIDNYNQYVVIGKIGAPFGINGWIKINSFTDPLANIWKFDNWLLNTDNCNLHDNIKHNLLHNFNLNLIPIARIKEISQKFLVLFENIHDRDDAAKLTNKYIVISRSCLPKLKEQEYYWIDLIGSKVYNADNCFLGIVDYIFATAAHDIMVIKNANHHNDINNQIDIQVNTNIITKSLNNNINIHKPKKKLKQSNKVQEYLIPYIFNDIVTEVDLFNKIIKVNWEI